jgi:hypothetical protein
MGNANNKGASHGERATSEPFLSSLHGLHSLFYHSGEGSPKIIVPPSSSLTSLHLANVSIDLKEALTLPSSLTYFNAFNVCYIKPQRDRMGSRILSTVLPPSLTSLTLAEDWTEVDTALAQNSLPQLRSLSLIRTTKLWTPPYRLLYPDQPLMALEDVTISGDYVEHIHRLLIVLGPRLRRMCIPIGSLPSGIEKWSVKVNQWPLLERLHLTHLNPPDASCIGMWGERVAHAHPNLHILVIDASRSLGDSAHICNHLIRSWPNNKDTSSVITEHKGVRTSSSSSSISDLLPNSIPPVIIFSEYYVILDPDEPSTLPWLFDSTNEHDSDGDDIYTVICASEQYEHEIVFPPRHSSSVELSAPYLHHLVNPPAIDYDNRFIWCAKTHIQNHDGIRTLLANNRWVIVKPAEFVPYSFVTSDPLPLLLDLASVMNNSSIPPSSCPINRVSATSATSSTSSITTSIATSSAQHHDACICSIPLHRS